MLKIEITQTGRKEIERLQINIEESLKRIIQFIPKSDLIGLGCIYVSDEPGQWKEHLADALGAYFQKFNNIPAYIEIYLSRLFSHIRNAESLRLIIPIQDIGIAHTIFHEVGHHVEKSKKHGIKKSDRERFAENYVQRLMAEYLSANAGTINSCFLNLEKIAGEKGLSEEVLRKMKDGWKAQFRGLDGKRAL